MRKLAITLALASSALASPALARDNSWYVGVDGGVTLVEDIRFDIGTVKRAGSVDNHAGFDADGNVGYDFGPFRVEAEVGYKQSGIDGYTSSVTTPRYTGATLGTAPAGAYPYAGGRSTALSFMLNGLLDFGDDDALQGFVGGGVGVARVSERVGLTRSGNFVNDSDTAFAYQGLAGIRAPLGEHLDAKLEYRFFTVDDVKLVDVTNRTLNGRFRSHSILGGITYNFGSPTPPPPPPPPPAPVEVAPPPVQAAPPPAPVCTPGPFIVFFEWDKSDITPEAASILDNAISNYQNCGNAQVMLAGHADRSGAASYNVGLSQRRADSVKAYFTAHSIPEGIIQTQAFGESRPRVETADGVREVQNRRVEIMYGPSAGQ
jgi:outer membrane protein OmpA-like peptidoglycan-associated protein/opacity protein-like surface antigen